MTPPAAKKWLHPQTVPRGFLRVYLLQLLSKGPESGYSIMQKIEEKTEGAWRPGAGTVYPLLKSLVKEGLVKGPEKGESTKTYAISSNGLKELEEIRSYIASAGRKERVMGTLFSDILPGNAFAPMVVNRMREGTQIFRSKVMEVKQPDRDLLLKEMKLLLENQLAWVNEQLAVAGPPRRRTSQ